MTPTEGALAAEADVRAAMQAALTPIEPGSATPKAARGLGDRYWTVVGNYHALLEMDEVGGI